MTFNKSLKPHRIAFLCFLKHYGLTDYFNWSFINENLEPIHNDFIDDVIVDKVVQLLELNKFSKINFLLNSILQNMLCLFSVT